MRCRVLWHIAKPEYIAQFDASHSHKMSTDKCTLFASRIAQIQ